jgi:hypothetical protein
VIRKVPSRTPWKLKKARKPFISYRTSDTAASQTFIMAVCNDSRTVTWMQFPKLDFAYAAPLSDHGGSDLTQPHETGIAF